MNIAKKINASANCRYGDPPVTVKKKVPSSAIAPTTAHTAVTTLEVRLSNMRAPPFVWFVTRRSYGQVSDKHRKAIHVAAGEFSEGQWVHGVRVSDRSTLGPSSCLYSPECVEVEFSKFISTILNICPYRAGAMRHLAAP